MSAQKRKAEDQHVKDGSDAPLAEKKQHREVELFTDQKPDQYDEEQLFGRKLKQFHTPTSQNQVWIMRGHAVIATLLCTSFREPRPTFLVLDYLIVKGPRSEILRSASASIAGLCRQDDFFGKSAFEVYFTLTADYADDRDLLLKMRPVKLETKDETQKAHNLKWIKWLSSRQEVDFILNCLTQVKPSAFTIGRHSVELQFEFKDQSELDTAISQMRILREENGFDAPAYESTSELQTAVDLGALPWRFQGNRSMGMRLAPRALRGLLSHDATDLGDIGYHRVSNLLTPFGVCRKFE